MGKYSDYKPSSQDQPFRLKGTYEVEITKAEREAGTWPSGDHYDRFVIEAKVVDIIEGNGRLGMYIPRSYNMRADVEDDAKVKKNIIDAIHTMGYLDFPFEDIEQLERGLPTIVGKTAFGLASYSSDPEHKYQNWRWLKPESAERKRDKAKSKGASGDGDVPF